MYFKNGLGLKRARWEVERKTRLNADHKSIITTVYLSAQATSHNLTRNLLVRPSALL